MAGGIPWAEVRTWIQSWGTGLKEMALTRDNFILALSAYLSEAGLREPISCAARFVLDHPDIESDTTPDDAAQELLCAARSATFAVPVPVTSDELLDAADIMQTMAEGHCSMGAVSEDVAKKRRRVANWLKEIAEQHGIIRRDESDDD